MKRLNLTAVSEEEFSVCSAHINYKKSQFPDGQQDITIDPTSVSSGDKVLIQSRFNTFRDLELIICAKKALDRLKVEDVTLFIPYILGARSDRDFTKGKGGTSYLVDVIAPIINSLNFQEVICIDAHSNVAPACIRNLRVVDNTSLVRKALKSIDNQDIVLISPDAGSLQKMYDVAKDLLLTADIVVSNKHRDVNGNFLGFSVPIKPEHKEKTLVWIDDICDGGGTFIGEAIEASKMGHIGKRYLIVTHGIFSAGYTKLSEIFDGMFCTDSVKSIGHYSGNSMEKTNVIQLPIFN